MSKSCSCSSNVSQVKMSPGSLSSDDDVSASILAIICFQQAFRLCWELEGDGDLARLREGPGTGERLDGPGTGERWEGPGTGEEVFGGAGIGVLVNGCEGHKAANSSSDAVAVDSDAVAVDSSA